MSWTLTQIRTYMRLQLSGGASPSDDEIGRAWIHALADFSRFVPQELIKEYTLDYDEVTDEQVTLTAHGTMKSLANKPVKYGSERIADDASETTVYTRDTDYTIDYSNGEITSISTGDIGATDTVFCNYTVSKHTIDISALTDLIRVFRVEYPLGEVPQHFATFEKYGDFLTLTSHPSSKPDQEQHELSDKRHAAVYYHETHTAPDTATSGSAPNWSNEILLTGCEAYSYLIEANSYEQLAATQVAASVTVLDEAWKEGTPDTGDLFLGIAALEAATATLALITSSGFHADANVSLGLALDELASLVDVDGTPATGELYAARVVEDCDPGAEGAIFLSNATSDAISAEAYLTAGDAKINLVNLGDEVARVNLEYANGAGAINDRLRDHARLHLERGTLHMQAIMGYVQEAQVRLSHIDKHSTEAQVEVGISNGYARISENHIAMADRLLVSTRQNLELAVMYRTLGIDRRDEFWSVLVSKHQLGTDKHSTQRS